MEIKQLLDTANEGYPDGFLAQFYDDMGKLLPDIGHMGDGLARYIVLELMETYEEGADSIDQLTEASKVVMNARNQLNEVITAIQQKLYAERNP